MQNIWKKETKATIDPSLGGSLNIWGISFLSFLCAYFSCNYICILHVKILCPNFFLNLTL